MTDTPQAGSNSNAQLKSIVERAERLEEERRALGDDLKDIWQEAKSAGYDVPALKELLKMRREDGTKKQKRESKEAFLEGYLQALGMLAELPLGQAALERAGIKEATR